MNVADTVGYQVRLDSKPPRPPAGSILYCTSGILLRRLQTNPGLHGCTHVFIDEAHERDVNTDLSLLLLKRAVHLNPELRVVVMSATLDTEVFTRYFDSCPIIEVPGRTFPVQTSYLDDIRQKYNLELSSTSEICKKEDAKPFVNCQEVADVIKAVDRAEPEGAILVFLPGWAEIKQVKLLLDQSYADSTHMILPVHSSLLVLCRIKSRERERERERERASQHNTTDKLSTTEQARMFSRPLPGVRKIVLATNIAETSITIPDVVFVVDSGAHKENRLVEGTGTASLESVWVSRAGARQRAGRAGRVQPGHCYKLYTKEKEDDFAPFTTPEILRVPLEQTVLDCKTYAPDEKVESFLSQLPEPPTQKAIQLAVSDLIDLGALTQSEQLTRLGSILSSLSVHPRLGLGLLWSPLVGNCVAAATCIAHAQLNVELFADAADRRDGGWASRDRIFEYSKSESDTSDHVALYWIQEEYERVVRERGRKAADAWCERYGLRKDRLAYAKFQYVCIYPPRAAHLWWKQVGGARILETTSKQAISNLYLEQLLSTPLVQPSPDVEELNRFSGVDELLPAALLCGPNQLLIVRAKIRTKGKLMADIKLVTSDGSRAHISSESVNQRVKRSCGALFAYSGGLLSRERRALVVRGTTRLAPAAVLALAPGALHQVETQDDTTALYLPRHKLRIYVPTSQVDHIMKLREMFANTFQYYTERNPKEVSYEENTVVSRFKVRLVKAIGRMLVEAHKELKNTTEDNER
ncbi:hypothetical protein MSG28_012650 [Choristoneura fumiferana]|uniref:Uncharacterized protein n=1 Tax=Choristoneura fumiferana TaxID=7141 RepID=A0ACC0JHG3_CHOFU|nr:hypothetical protein MSG28_012650 [Choristoneura fumiferana]